MKADLHLHSTASDGTLEPGELVALAAELGFTHLALTDHDSVDGLARAMDAARDCGVTLIPGVELSCGAQKEIHILGYGFDPYDERMLEFCRTRTMERQERAAKMVRQLCENGVEISLDRVMALARGVVARPHVARVLVEAGYANSVSSAFDKYLLPGKCGYVPKAEVKVAEAAKLIAGAGGAGLAAAVMAGSISKDVVVLEKTQDVGGNTRLADAFNAVDPAVQKPPANRTQAMELDRFARRNGLLVTGGSDFHGPQVRQSCIGDGLDRWTTAEADIQKLLNRIGV